MLSQAPLLGLAHLHFPNFSVKNHPGVLFSEHVAGIYVGYIPAIPQLWTEPELLRSMNERRKISKGKRLWIQEAIRSPTLLAAVPVSWF